MFQLSREEVTGLSSQSVISSRGGRRTPPYAFTEQGEAMLSSVLHGERAAQVDVEIMRTFVRLREVISSHANLARKLTTVVRPPYAGLGRIHRVPRGRKQMTTAATEASMIPCWNASQS
jgi:hypothetical protein